MASSKKSNDGVVPVVFNANTKYGKKGEFGYIPEGFADAWLDKGIVLSAVKEAKKAEKVEKVEAKKKVIVEEVQDESSSEGESRDVESSFDESVFDEGSE